MATITVTLTQSCPANNHVALAISGDRTGTIRTSIEDMFDSLNIEDVESFISVMLRLHSSGKTRAQMRNALITGITMTTVSV